MYQDEMKAGSNRDYYAEPFFHYNLFLSISLLLFFLTKFRFNLNFLLLLTKQMVKITLITMLEYVLFDKKKRKHKKKLPYYS